MRRPCSNVYQCRTVHSSSNLVQLGAAAETDMITHGPSFNTCHVHFVLKSRAHFSSTRHNTTTNTNNNRIRPHSYPNHHTSSCASVRRMLGKQQRIYSWSPTADVCSAPEQARNRESRLFVEAFSPTLTPTIMTRAAATVTNTRLCLPP